MEISAVICEYNPFHSGHAYHLARTREEAPGAVVCVMSGNFVQRGEAAIADKFARAEAAVRGGADLVVELPHAFAMAAAPRFAAAGVHLAALCGAKTLSFGAECADDKLLSRACALCESEQIKESLRENLSRGLDYPAALTAAVRAADPAAAQILKSPNNALAVEYLRALAAYPGMTPLAVARTGAGHDGEYRGDTASASFIRRLLAAGGQARDFLPPESIRILERERARGAFPVTGQALDTVVLSALRRMDKDDYVNLPDVAEGLENRLFAAAREAVSLDDFCLRVKTKRYTYARIRRIAMAAYTGLTKAHQAALPDYLRVLALNDTGRRILASRPEDVPVVSKPAARRLDAQDEALFALEARADALWALGCPDPQARAYSAYKKSPVYVGD